ncbi:MAG: methyltransferase domain-containing protein, partial [Alphaproteobacteria bacterium]|nr:methyltransferase domain-containing protein [Alphaproteobacteria bacterium]
MYTDIVEMREFYDTTTGQAVRRILSNRIGQIWPHLQCEKIAVLGYGVPVLRPLFRPTLSFMAMMPSEQGVVYWPREGPNISCLTELNDLPLPDECVDRVIMMHGLEGAAEPHDVLREAWRILKPQGRFLAIV